MTKEAVLKNIYDSIHSTNTYADHKEAIDIVTNYIDKSSVDMGPANVLITLNEILKEADSNTSYRSQFDDFISDQKIPSSNDNRKSTTFLINELVNPVSARIESAIDQAQVHFHEYNPQPYRNGAYGLDSAFGGLCNWHRAQRRLAHLIDSYPEKESLQPGLDCIIAKMRDNRALLSEFYDWDQNNSYGNLEDIRDGKGIAAKKSTLDELVSLNALIHVLKVNRGLEMIRSRSVDDHSLHTELKDILRPKLMESADLANQMDDWRRGDRGEHLVVVAEACGLDMNRKDLRLLCNTIQRSHDYRIPSPDESLSPGM